MKIRCVGFSDQERWHNAFQIDETKINMAGCLDGTPDGVAGSIPAKTTKEGTKTSPAKTGDETNGK